MMADQITFLTQAVTDLSDAADFYETQKNELGVYFSDSLIADIESLKLSAGVHPVYFGLHRMLSKHFPFAIYYNLHDRVVHIIAILDMRQNPAWARDQLQARRA